MTKRQPDGTFCATNNPSQGPEARILCVDGAGLLVSPTIAKVLAERGYNTRAAGTAVSYALIPVSETLLRWANAVVCADTEHWKSVVSRTGPLGLEIPVFNLKIPSMYERNATILTRLIRARLAEEGFFKKVPVLPAKVGV